MPSGPTWLDVRDHLAARLGDADLPPVWLDAEADAGRLAGRGIGDCDVRDVQRSLFLDDAARLTRAARLGVALHDVDALDDDAVLLRQDGADLAGLAAVLAGQDDDVVAPANAGGH